MINNMFNVACKINKINCKIKVINIWYFYKSTAQFDILIDFIAIELKNDKLLNSFVMCKHNILNFLKQHEQH